MFVNQCTLQAQKCQLHPTKLRNEWINPLALFYSLPGWCHLRKDYYIRYYHIFSFRIYWLRLKEKQPLWYPVDILTNILPPLLNFKIMKWNSSPNTMYLWWLSTPCYLELVSHCNIFHIVVTMCCTPLSWFLFGF